MKTLNIVYSETAVKQLKRIAKGDRKSAAMIIESIESYASAPSAGHDIKVLKGKLGTFKRLRSGNYRIIFDEKGCVMYIYEVKHRQEAYND